MSFRMELILDCVLVFSCCFSVLNIIFPVEEVAYDDEK